MSKSKYPKEKFMKKLKAYISYGGRPEMWSASLILENGWVAFGHLCSHPYFMKSDLLERREERKEVFKRMGYEVEIIGEPDPGGTGLPDWLLEKNQNEENYKEFLEEYKKVEEEIKNETKG